VGPVDLAPNPRLERRSGDGQQPPAIGVFEHPQNTAAAR
jgi:hypothetical protein